jgi:glycosyltransferase involved in cell wall biosynthesis
MNWCVVIPTYNNEKSLEQVLQDVMELTGNLIVVDDGSTDNTGKILQRHQGITMIHLPGNMGKGYALRKGFEAALRQGFTHAITMDSDGQHYASDIVNLIRKADECPDALIVGSRTLPQDKMKRGSSFANRFSNSWFRLIAGVSLPDTQSGFRLYPLQMLGDMHFFTSKYEFELEVLYRAAWKNIPLTSIPIRVFYPSREERVSHFRPFRDFFRISLLNAVCVFIVLLYVKPFSFLQYLKKERISGFIKKQVMQTADSTSKTILSVMLGVFMGIVPIWGYQLITALAMAYLLKLNKFIVAVAANISIPPMIPLILYLSYITGGYVLSVDTHPAFSKDISLAWVENNLLQYVVGSAVFAVIASVFSGLLTFLLLKVFRRKPAIIG